MHSFAISALTLALAGFAAAAPIVLPVEVDVGDVYVGGVVAAPVDSALGTVTGVSPVPLDRRQDGGLFAGAELGDILADVEVDVRTLPNLENLLGGTHVSVNDVASKIGQVLATSPAGPVLLPLLGQLNVILTSATDKLQSLTGVQIMDMISSVENTEIGTDTVTNALSTVQGKVSDISGQVGTMMSNVEDKVGSTDPTGTVAAAISQVKNSLSALQSKASALQSTLSTLLAPATSELAPVTSELAPVTDAAAPVLSELDGLPVVGGLL